MMRGKRLAGRAIGLLIVLVAWGAVLGAAPRADLDHYLVGKWHQDVGNMSGETVFNTNHTFTSLAWTRGTTYRTGARGEWEIRNEDQLWTHNEECSPNPCIAEWDSTRVEVLDEDHFRNRFGEVYRMR
jgi:hypothetical protein